MFTAPNFRTSKWSSLRTALALPLIVGAVSVGAAETAKPAATNQSTFISAGILKQAPQFYSVNVGGAKITAISDGTIPLDAA